MSEAAPLLRAEGLAKRFGGVPALEDASLELRAGEIHALVGANGAGKSTLLRILGGALRPDAGRVLLDGRPYAPRSPRDAEARGLTCVAQEIALLPRLTVEENLVVGREPDARGPFRRPARERARARTALARVGLDVDPAAQVGALPVATRQMIAVARALDAEARVLVLDEPTASLDAPEVARLFALLRDLRTRGLAIVFVSHFLDQIYDLCDRATILRDGRVVGGGALATLPRLELVRRMLGGADAAPPAAVDIGPRPSAEVVPPALEARGLGRRGAVAPFDLALRRGEIVGLAGLLGSGRSETARLLGGLDRADVGALRRDGRPLRVRGPSDALRAGIAFTPEERKAEGLCLGLSAEDNLVLPEQARRGILRPLGRAERAARLADAVKEFDLKGADPAGAAATLSGGNQQKLLLASRTQTRPDVLVLDEPTRGVDVGARAKIEGVVAALAAAGAAVLLVIAEAERLVAAATKIILLRDRRVVGELPRGASADDVVRALAEPSPSDAAAEGVRAP